MLSLELFFSLAAQVLGRPLDDDQRGVVAAGPDCTLFVVAGPGSGKTTVLALRVLRHILVDGMEPDSIVATTFTRRAARELRSRILGWGDEIRHLALLSTEVPPHVREAVKRIDFNAVVTGTLDQLIEELLTRYRQPGSAPPVILETFVSRGLILKRGLFEERRFEDQLLWDYARRMGVSAWGGRVPKLTRFLKEVRERWYHDLIDTERYLRETCACTVCDPHPHPGIAVLGRALEAYQAALNETETCDFEALEHRFLEELSSGRLDAFRSRLRCMLVDEYQDTNLLQETIYFELARQCSTNRGGICVVGDDDQSLYRFRGATVDLFTAFPRRVKERLGLTPSLHYLKNNYRSVPSIVDFVRDYVQLDEEFQRVRAEGKPAIVAQRRAMHNPPVLGMFRETVEELAEDLAELIHDVFNGDGLDIPGFGRVRRGAAGSVGDCALLCFSPQEFSGNRPRLPFYLRRALAERGIKVFNPRGQALNRIQVIQILGGLLLECIDPDGQVAASIRNLPQDARRVFGQWRQHCREYINSDPEPARPIGLRQFVSACQAKALGEQGEDVSLTELVYKLVTWIPPLQDDVEGLVYLEVILRAISASTHLNPFGGHVRLGGGNPASVRAAYWDLLVPLATGAIDVEEDLLETLPRDRVNILSIHQSKGLEFPMVIVDVGSAFTGNHLAQAKMRYPDRGDGPHYLEDELRQFSPLGRPTRSGKDRAFDDLYRLYYVAFSRAQDLLVLCGLHGVKNGNIRNVATGWDRHGNWVWGPGLPNLVHL